MVHTTIHVTLIEGATGQVLGQTDLPIDQLPTSFAESTTLHIGEQDWHVDHAEPMRAEEFGRSGALRLTLSRISYMDPRKVLFTLPTLEDALPRSEEQTTAQSSRNLELHEDDWRQVEFVSVTYAREIEAELTDIETIYREHRVPDGPILGFRSIHTRKRIPAPIKPTIAIKDIYAALGVTEASFDAISFKRIPGAVPASFGIQVGDLIVYGAGDAASARCLGILWRSSSLPEPTLLSLQRFMDAYRLYLVDWPQMTVVPPHEIEPLRRYFSGQ